MATKESIGQRLAGLPSHIQRGLHELFHHLFDEIEHLRAELRSLTGGDTAPEAPTAETGDVAPNVKPEVTEPTEQRQKSEPTESLPDELPPADGATTEAPTTETGDNA